MRSDPTTPTAWANVLTRMWGPRFPVGVEQISLEYSKRFDDPIHAVKQAEIETFEGALYFLPKRQGWALLYNPSIHSPGRINFTLAHELGHYLVHRKTRPGNFECGEARILGFDPDEEQRRIEQEADRFASYLLMPLDDYRAQVGRQKMTLDLLRHCADRYGVSLTAAALKWIEHTADCAAIVVATNGFVLWCRRSDAARRSRIYYPKGMPLPPNSLAAQPVLAAGAPNEGVELPRDVWSTTSPCREIAIVADRYEMTISLIQFEPPAYVPMDWIAEASEDTFDRFNRTPR